MRNILFIVALFFTSLNYSQTFSKGSITLKSNETREGKVYIDNSTGTVLLKNGFNTSSINFDAITAIQIGKESYTPLSQDANTFLASKLASGKASLYKIGNDSYFIDNGDLSKSFNINDDQNVLPGILSLLYSDCNEIRSSIEKKGFINKEDLTTLTNQYNSCAHSSYTPTDKEVARASKHNTDQASLYAGIGANLNSVSFRASDDTESLVGAQIRLGVEVSPSFLGILQGNLHAFLEGSANFTGDKDFSNNTNPVNFSTNSYRVQLGLHYMFNKSGAIKPLLGFGIGVTSDSFSGSILDNEFQIDGGNPIFAPRIGIRFKLKNEKHIGVLIEYITSYDNDLTFPTQSGIIPLQVTNENIGIGINYHF